MKSFPAVSRRGSGAQKYNNPPCYRSSTVRAASSEAFKLLKDKSKREAHIPSEEVRSF